MDYAGPLKETPRGKRYILVVVDAASSFPFVFPVGSTRLEQTHRALREVFSLIGCPRVVRSDNSSHFKNVKLRDWHMTNGVRHKFGLVYNPQGQGKVEKLIVTIKSRLLATTDVSDRLPSWDLSNFLSQ